MQNNYFSLLMMSLFILLTSMTTSLTGQTLQVDPAVRIGKLSNGMTYYIRHNEEPKERASFFIIQNVGALLEDDTQNGLAHFLEHMAFNGTKHFPEKGIINTLEKHGIAYGKNINAYTSYSETVYNLSDVPIKHVGLVDTCLLVLNDWAHYLLLTDKEIDLERNVIKEEWRTIRTADFRMQRTYFPVLLKGSKYAERDVIGDSSIIKHFNYETLRKFYHDWYRTDLQAIAVVGDINVDEVEAKIKTLFGAIPAVVNAAVRPEHEVPYHKETLFVAARDKEATQYTVNIYIKHASAKPAEKNMAYYREQYVQDLFNTIMRERISELLQKGVPPFVTGTVGYYGLVRGYDMTVISASAKPDQEDVALKAIYTEAQRVLRYGITEGELNRAKSNMLTQLETRWKQRDKITNDAYVDNFQENFLSNEPMTSIDFDWETVPKLLPTITAAEISSKVKEWIVPENRVIIAMGPDNEKSKVLSESQALAILQDVEKSQIAPFEDAKVATSLINETLKGSKIVKTKKLPELNAVEWTLGNNAKVIYRLADYEKDNVTLIGNSPGGSSLYSSKDIASALMLSSFISMYGVGNFDAMTLKKMLTGKNVNLNVSLSELKETVSGSSAPKDFETLLQLLYLQFEKPRFDKEAYQTMKARYAAYLANMSNDPQKIMSDSLSMILTNYNKRTKLINPSLLEEISFEQMEKIYRERFTDAGDFNFFIVGNIEEEKLKPLVEQYIGSIKDIPRKEKWIDNNVEGPKGMTTKDIPIPLQTKKATVVVNFNKTDVYDVKSNMALDIIKGVLTLRYLEEVREKEGGTYGVSVSATFDHFPKAEKTVLLKFDTDPERATYLKSILYREIDKIVANGPTAEDLDKVIKNKIKDREQRKLHNNYWLSSLLYLYEHGINPDSPEAYDKVLAVMTIEEIKKFAAGFFPKADVVDLIFSPKPE